MIGQCAATVAKGNGRGPEWQRRCDDDKAHGLVEDHGLQRTEPECADQQRQPKFRTAKTDQPAECADYRTAAESGRALRAGAAVAVGL